MKVIKNKAFRFLMFLIGYVGFVSTVVFMFIAVVSYAYLDGSAEKSVPFAESQNIKERINNTVYFINSSTKFEKKVENIKLGEKKILIHDLNGSENNKTINVKEFLASNNPADALYYGFINSTNSFYFDDSYDYFSHVAENPSGEFYKMSVNDYLSYIKEYGFKYDSRLMNKYTQELYDPEVSYEESSSEKEDVYEIKVNDDDPQSDENLTVSVNMLSDKEYEMIYKKIYKNLSGDLYINDDDDIYILYADDKMIIYNETCKYLYRIGGDKQQGHQNLENLNNDSIYLAYSDDMSPEYFINAYMYCSAEEAVFGILSKQEQNVVLSMDISYNNDSGINSSFSLDGKTISNMNIYDVDYLPDIFMEEDGNYNISFEGFCSKLEKVADAYVYYNSNDNELTQWYKNENGEIVQFDYINDTLLNSIKRTNDESFVIGIKIYDKSSNFRDSYLVYKLTQSVPYPITLVLISFLVFLIAFVLLTIGEDKKIIFIDRIPYFVYLFIIGSVAFAGIYMLYIAAKSVTRFIEMFMTEPTGMILAVLVAGGIAYLIFTVFYLSVIRRIKCHKFLDGFITFWFIKLLIKSFKSLKGKVRLIITTLLFLLVSAFVFIFLLNISSTDEMVVSVIALAIIDITAVIAVIRYMTDINRILDVSHKIENGELDAKVDTTKLLFNNREMGESLNNLGEGLSKAVESSVRDERTKAELITNVSHDIKTPLTSIISYVDLLKREEIDNPKAKEYIEVLDKKSERLKQLILDLIEVSKTSTGNIELERIDMNLIELIGQAVGEYEDKFMEKNLELVESVSSDRIIINADGRRIFRVIDNILGNVYKYSMEGTRVYLNAGLSSDGTNAVISLKNVSRKMLNISADELTERFVRGDKSRSTEGSGLGLSIAKNLTELHGGTFKISIDGDLFKVIITLPISKKDEKYESSNSEERSDSNELKDSNESNNSNEFNENISDVVEPPLIG